MLNVKGITNNRYELLGDWIKKNYSDKEIESVSSMHKGVTDNTSLITFLNKDKIVLKYCNNYQLGSIIKLRWQYGVQSDLLNVFPVPKVFKYCSDNSIIGQPFYIMEHVDGQSNYDFNSVEKSFNLLSQLHTDDSLNFIKKKYKKNITMDHIIKKTYDQYKLVEKNKNIDIDYIFNWLEKNLPKNEISSFCHNDWRMSNILFSNSGSIRSVIDWELSGIGDPRSDLGIAMAYWCEQDNSDWQGISPEPPFKFNKNKKKEIIESFFNKTNLDYSDWKFFEVFGLFRLIRVAQLGGHNHEAGLTDNKLYKNIDTSIDIIFNKCIKKIGDIYEE